jgi:hypothetical protein
MAKHAAIERKNHAGGKVSMGSLSRKISCGYKGIPKTQEKRQFPCLLDRLHYLKFLEAKATMIEKALDALCLDYLAKEKETGVNPMPKFHEFWHGIRSLREEFHNLGEESTNEHGHRETNCITTENQAGIGL